MFFKKIIHSFVHSCVCSSLICETMWRSSFCTDRCWVNLIDPFLFYLSPVFPPNSLMFHPIVYIRSTLKEGLF